MRLVQCPGRRITQSSPALPVIFPPMEEGVSPSDFDLRRLSILRICSDLKMRWYSWIMRVTKGYLCLKSSDKSIMWKMIKCEVGYPCTIWSRAHATLLMMVMDQNLLSCWIETPALLGKRLARVKRRHGIVGHNEIFYDTSHENSS